MEGEYYKTKESVNEYIKLAKDVSGIDLIERLKKHLASHSLLLEIGSGPGTDWEILRDTFDVIGSDNSEEFLSHLKTKFPKGEFHLIDASSLEIDKTMDGIYSNKVLHHLKDDELTKSIQRQHEILNKDGIICHSFWKGEGSEIFKGLFVNYHTHESIQNHFEEHFEIILSEDYAEFDENDSILVIAKKK